MTVKLLAILATGMLLASCGASDAEPDDQANEGAATPTSDVGATGSADAFEARLAALDVAVATWRDADTIDDAHVAAETAANLVVGPNGPGYGDRNGDGTIDGMVLDGVLPGLDGTPEGLALPLAGNECVERDVLGGSWDDPAQRWTTMEETIDAWTRSSNTMPSLPSHPMRVVGWSTFTLATDSLDEAHEYAGHAKLHVDVSLAALDC
ncbi:MAG: hypothetical protein WBP59_11095 [Ilumatobacteraceae bacterium]